MEGRATGGAALDHGRPYSVHHAVAVDGGDCHPDRRAEPRESSKQSARQSQHSARHRGGPRDRRPGYHPRSRAFGKTGWSKEKSIAVDFKHPNIISAKDIPAAPKTAD